MEKKKKKYENPEVSGTDTLGEEELEERLVLEGTLDDSVNIDETEERIEKLEEKTTPEELEREKKEIKEFGKKPKKKKH